MDIKAAAIELLDLAINQRKVAEAFTKHVAPHYRQHNPDYASGRDGAIAGLSAWVASIPELRYDIKRIFVDGDHVILHAHVTKDRRDRGNAVIDILRRENGQFVEHWDVIQPVPESANNENSMF